ncbi:hypothetical protein M758_8G079100 [Ceratodon purpureus]|nr:hypothetical protein M758_8G079100 [Ceratodon purpureus]
MAAMAQRRWLMVLLLLHLVVVVVVALDSGACPSYPADPAWKAGVDEAQASGIRVRVMRTLRILAGTFQQGDRLLLTRPGSDAVKEDEVQGLRLVVMKAELSDSRDVFAVSVMVTLGFWPKFAPVGLRGGRGRIPGAEATSQDVTMIGDGTFDEKSGALCVIGCIGSVCKYKISLMYPAPKSVHRISTFGNLSSVVEASDPTYFDPVSVHAITDGPFQYTMNATLASTCPKLQPDVAVGKLWREEKVCNQGWASSHQVWSTQAFEVSWNPECEGANCSPFAVVGKAAGGNSSSLRFDRVRCDGDRVQGILVVANYLAPVDRFADPTAVDGTLIAEGTWDSTTGRMCMIACRLFGNKEDCQIAVTMQFPLTFTITQRSLVVGHIESLRNTTDPAYFKRITFKQVSSGLQVTRFTSVTNEPEYIYTKVDMAKAHCGLTQKEADSSVTYPSGVDWRDLEFHGAKDDHSKSRSGVNPFVSLNLFTFGEKFRTYGQLHVTSANVTGLGSQGIMNVSYTIFYQLGKSETLDATMAGEGVYDPGSGKLCLIGCRGVDLKQKNLQELEGDGEKDCQVFYSVQLPPVDSTEVLKGTVTSLRPPIDSLYFEPQTFSGSVHEQIVESVWRVDLEIVMSVVMLTLTVVFIILQLVYSNRYPETLPYISTSMLLLLSLAHMIPLVLNFEALFQKKQKGYQMVERAAGWPEVNEVVVRLTTMAAMLLQLRLLQLVWKSRVKSRANGDLGPAVQERRVLFTVLPMYVLGGVIAILVHAVFGFRPYEREFLWRSNEGGLWWDITAYGGLLLDFHLFPQVVGNVLWGAKEQAPLSKYFYFGMALVRSLPHVYDLCRQFKFIPSFADSYMYANPEWDFYSVTSDILIPFIILVLAILVYMQQRWGGRCVLPRRWRSSFEYEKVDITGT